MGDGSGQSRIEVRPRGVATQIIPFVTYRWDKQHHVQHGAMRAKAERVPMGRLHE